MTHENMHQRIRYHRGRASTFDCVDCGRPARHWSYNHGCADEVLDEARGLVLCPHIEHYSPRCVPCHIAYDGNDRSGENHARAKLTEEDVREIRRMYSIGERSQQSIADEYGVAQHTVSKLLRRKTWAHVT